MLTLQGTIIDVEGFKSKKGKLLITAIMKGMDRKVYNLIGFDEKENLVSVGDIVTMKVSPPQQGKDAFFMNGLVENE